MLTATLELSNLMMSYTSLQLPPNDLYTREHSGNECYTKNEIFCYQKCSQNTLMHCNIMKFEMDSLKLLVYLYDSLIGFTSTESRGINIMGSTR